MYGTSDFKKNLKILYKNQPYVIVDFQHVKPGKGNQFTRTKLKNLLTGANIDLTVRSGEKFHIPDIIYKDMTFLYKDGTQYHFMDSSTYEQIAVEQKIIEDSCLFLKSDLPVTVCLYNGNVINVELPKSVTLKVTQTDVGFKGNTISNTFKPAQLETGHKLQVPLHINEGDEVKINTEDGKYIERVKQG